MERDVTLALVMVVVKMDELRPEMSLKLQLQYIEHHTEICLRVNVCLPKHKNNIV